MVVHVGYGHCLPLDQSTLFVSAIRSGKFTATAAATTTLCACGWGGVLPDLAQ